MNIKEIAKIAAVAIAVVYASNRVPSVRRIIG